MDSQIKFHSQIYSFNLPLRQSIHINHDTINRRTGLILAISTGRDLVGYGEISPLPGLHKETYKDAHSQLVEFCKHLSSSQISKHEWDTNKLIPETNLYPSVRFGIESAFINLLSKIHNISPVQVLNPLNKVAKIKINGLIAREERIQDQAKYLSQNGYLTVKLKLGKDTIESDIEKVIHLYDQLKTGTKIRLDVNRCWDYSDAMQFASGIKNIPIEYIEEPLKNHIELPKYVKKTGIPVALDESLKENIFNSFLPDWCSAIIIKPAFIGGVKKTIDYLKLANKIGIKTIISDTFQSGVGIGMLANLGALAGGEKTAMGFDTYRWLDRDILESRIEILNGNIDLIAVNKAQHQLNFSVLNRIY